MSNRIVRWLVAGSWCVVLMATLAGCTNDSVSSAARNGVASFISGVFNAAVYEAIGP